MAVICQTCNGRAFASFDALHRHMKDSKKAHHFCQLCTQDFSSRDGLVEHSSVHHADMSCSAPTCNRIFANEKALLSHFLDSPKHPKCRACGVGFRNVRDQSIHKREAHGATGRRKRSRPFSPIYVDSVSPQSTPSALWSPTLSSPQAGIPTRDTPTPELQRAQSMEDIFNASFTSMFPSTPTSEIRGQMIGENRGDFVSSPMPALSFRDSPRDKGVEELASPKYSRSPSRPGRSRSRSSSRHSSRSHSPPSSLGNNYAPSASSTSAHNSSNHPNEPFRLAYDESLHVDGNSEHTRNCPSRLGLESSARVNHGQSIVNDQQEQPASPFDTNFLSQLKREEAISSPLLKTIAAIPAEATGDILSSEDEFRTLTPVSVQRPWDAPGGKSQPDFAKDDGHVQTSAGSSHLRGSDLRAILSRSANRKNSEKLSSLRRLTLSTPTMTSTQGPSTIRPSSLLARLSRGREASSSNSSGLASTSLQRPTRRPEGRRRLSLSPSLPPIPESSLRESSPRPPSRADSDSDRESLGIFELNAHDLLFGGNLSEDDEDGLSPPTSVAPTDVECEELGSHEDERQDIVEDEGADLSDGSCSSPPPLIIEELNRMVREMCPPSPEEEDPFADSFSASGSPCASSSMDLNIKSLPTGKVSSHGSSAALPVVSNDSALTLSVPLRSESSNGTDGQDCATTPVGGIRVKAPFIEAQSPFTAPEDVNAEDVYLTPDELDDDSPARGVSVVDDTPFFQMPEPDVRLDEIFDLSMDSFNSESTQDSGTQFIEENHPLGKLISLDSPLVATPWQHNLAPLSPPPSPGHDEHQEITHDVQALFTHSNSPSSSPRSANQASTPVKMHCRLCMLDPCEDPTATFCGHVFCYRCITREVVEKASCPTCHTPTLLYCLFRLDLTS